MKIPGKQMNLSKELTTETILGVIRNNFNSYKS